MEGFALFRMPYAKECRFILGEVSELTSCADLDGRQGFIMAPFAPSAKEPILLIQGECIMVNDSLAKLEKQLTINLEPLTLNLEPLTLNPESLAHSRADYHIDFTNFHAHLQNGDFRKLVLSRSIDIPCPPSECPPSKCPPSKCPTSECPPSECPTIPSSGLTASSMGYPIALFEKACESYPRVMVALVFTPQSGLWLTATPEVLLAGGDGQWQTMALAGTLAYKDDLRWSDKNIQEQRYVATYIVKQLERFTGDFTEEGPYTVRAGHLAHLRSDFRFTLYNNTRVGELLQALHPTPAVCGLPKEAAFEFIQQYEHHRRSYYSGFMGPLAIDQSTHLFVTLRCMQIFRNAYRLYAGGGLLKDSVEEQEWLETETKLDTMRRIVLNDEF